MGAPEQVELLTEQHSISTSTFHDLNGDGSLDLILAGHLLPASFSSTSPTTAAQVSFASAVDDDGRVVAEARNREVDSFLVAYLLDPTTGEYASEPIELLNIEPSSADNDSAATLMQAQHDP